MNDLTQSQHETPETHRINSWAKPLVELQTEFLKDTIDGDYKTRLLNNLLRYSRNLFFTLNDTNTSADASTQKTLELSTDLIQMARVEKDRRGPLAAEVLFFIRSRIFELKSPLQGQKPFFRNPLATEFERFAKGQTTIANQTVDFLVPIASYFGIQDRKSFRKMRENPGDSQVGILEVPPHLIPVFEISKVISGKSSPNSPDHFWVLGKGLNPLAAIPMQGSPETLFLRKTQIQQIQDHSRLNKAGILSGICLVSNGKKLPILNVERLLRAGQT